MAVNKVVYGNNTLIDLSTDTISSASDIASGKVGHLRDGSVVTGTASSGIGTLLATQSLGTQSTTSTSAVEIDQQVTVPDVGSYDLLIVETSVDTVVNGKHTCTTNPIFLNATSNVGTKTGATIATMKQNFKMSGSVTSVRTSTTAYGIYPTACSVSNNTATITMSKKYNSTNTSTINGAYTTRVYGVNLYELIGG